MLRSSQSLLHRKDNQRTTIPDIFSRIGYRDQHVTTARTPRNTAWIFIYSWFTHLCNCLRWNCMYHSAAITSRSRQRAFSANVEVDLNTSTFGLEENTGLRLLLLSCDQLITTSSPHKTGCSFICCYFTLHSCLSPLFGFYRCQVLCVFFSLSLLFFYSLHR